MSLKFAADVVKNFRILAVLPHLCKLREAENWISQSASKGNMGISLWCGLGGYIVESTHALLCLAYLIHLIIHRYSKCMGINVLFINTVRSTVSDIYSSFIYCTWRRTFHHALGHIISWEIHVCNKFQTLQFRPIF